MDKTISEKIRHLRLSKGYSQVYLAQLAQLNLRTIQRIENGDTEARGDSLNRIAASLGVTVETFTSAGNAIENTGVALMQNKTYLILMNVSALASIFFFRIPFLGVLLPIIFWAMKKDAVIGVREEGRKIINFQLTWLLFALVATLAFVGGKIFHIGIFNLPNVGGLGQTETIIITILGILGINVALVVINTIRIAINKPVWYQPAISFIKKKKD